MPPRKRKASVVLTTMTKTDREEMPPPPDPVVPSKILEKEVHALKRCLRVSSQGQLCPEETIHGFKNTVTKTGLIYAHYAESRRV